MRKIYNKSALYITDILELIRTKKILIQDIEKTSLYLRAVSYHRLSPYIESLLRNNNPSYLPNFENAWKLYCFDRELKLLINDAIERIEVAFRTSLSETMSCRYSPFWFLDEKIFKNSVNYIGFMKQIDTACQDKHNSSIQEYYHHYNHPQYPPSWILFECLSFGVCISAFCNIKKLKDRKEICNIFKEHPTTMQSWLYAIRYTRNLCAHHSRIWNRWFVVSPALSFMLGNNFNKQNTCYAQLIILNKLLEKISPENRWKIRLKSLLEKNNTLPIYEMGFSKDWKNDDFWNQDALFHYKIAKENILI